MSIFHGKSKIRNSFHWISLSFRDPASASLAARGVNVDTEAHRKAAAWAWFQRGTDAVLPNNIVERRPVPATNRVVSRSESRFKVEAMRESSNNLSSTSVRNSQMNLYDEFDIQGLKKQMARFMHSHFRPPSDSSQPRETDRSFSDLSGPGNTRRRNSVKLCTARMNVDGSWSNAQTEGSLVLAEERMQPRSRKSSFKWPLSAVQKLFHKFSRVSNHPDSKANGVVKNGHQQRPQCTPQAPLPAKTPSRRRHSENFSSFFTRRSSDNSPPKGGGRTRRKSESFSPQLKEGKFDEFRYSRDEIQLPQQADTPPRRRHSESFSIYVTRNSFPESFSAYVTEKVPSRRRHSDSFSASITASGEADFEYSPRQLWPEPANSQDKSLFLKQLAIGKPLCEYCGRTV